MSSVERGGSGWRGVCLIAITYVYFLLFAQFAFLHRLADLGIADAHLKIVMAAMALGGVAFSLLAATRLLGASPRMRLQAGLAVCGCAALLSLLSLSLVASVLTALLIGCGLGLLTVTLVSHLDLWIGGTNAMLKTALGTGTGYLLCNVPSLFTAAPKHQAVIVAGLCGLGLFACATRVSTKDASAEVVPAPPFAVVLIGFTALIWLDSAAFFIIQSTPALKAGTWEGTLHLYTNAALHLGAALGAGWLLRRRGLAATLMPAMLCLAAACLLLLDPTRVVLASLLYPVGVSLYSVALVAYPSLVLAGLPASQRATKAATIYAVAGWCGSAMGIGMAQHLGHVPVAFVAVACALVVGPQLPTLLQRWRREASAAVVLLVVAWGVTALLHGRDQAAGTDAIERGRNVYIAEGCLNCHSQYVRPNSPDVMMWGPVQTLEELRAQHPPLIGNRRQGPDLSEVGLRRSPLWLEAHLRDPRALTPGSFMPSYAYLFAPSDSRGSDLVAYLGGLHTSGAAAQLELEQRWSPAATAVAQASRSEGQQLYASECATCHDANGATRVRWRAKFRRLPPELAASDWPQQVASMPQQRLEQIVKFGIPGTDMPGHEYFTDEQVASLALWIKSGAPAAATAAWVRSGSHGDAAQAVIP